MERGRGIGWVLESEDSAVAAHEVGHVHVFCVGNETVGIFENHSEKAVVRSLRLSGQVQAHEGEEAALRCLTRARTGRGRNVREARSPSPPGA